MADSGANPGPEVNDKTNESRSTAKFTRCRTGCLRCRKRRRKCDERKPQCQNCIDKKLDCNYGLQVTFLPKNSITVAAGEIQAPVDRRASYSKIQFVKEDPLAIDTEDLATEEHLTRPYSSTPSVSNTPLPPPSPISSHIFSANDEFAVQGLLALGTHPGGSESIPISTILNVAEEGAAAQPSFVVDAPSITIGGPGAGEGVVSPGFISRVQEGLMPTVQPISNYDARNSSIAGSNLFSESISDTRKIKLLQYYRYDIAPWLDVHDLSHSFGITALQTAVNSSSPQLLSALLALAETCLSQKARSVQFEDARIYSDQPELQDFTEAVLLRVFTELRSLVSDVAAAWTRSETTHIETQLVHSALGPGMEAAVYWMFLRIDIGKALATDTHLRTPLPDLPLPSLALLTRAENTQARVNHYAQVLLWLCGKALNTYHHNDQDHESPYQLPAPGPENWLQTFEELSEWHYLRPQEFQPMVEVELNNADLNPASEFPLILFTNGAATLCNQLYHTAMLLMLECKPRTALLNRHQNPAMLSPLWHAQRVCGIALNNDRRECWDPCLLASFLLAARYMTHEAQQVEIGKGFERTHGLTGWSVGEYLVQLREEWSFLDGVE
ncbi:hypothetical protein BJX70DRAFT_87591 [Aspergillus crustosus]